MQKLLPLRGSTTPLFREPRSSWAQFLRFSLFERLAESITCVFSTSEIFRRENLQCICGTCHGYKLQADHKLCMGDKLGYLEILRTHHFDLVRVERALGFYGL